MLEEVELFDDGDWNTWGSHRTRLYKCPECGRVHEFIETNGVYTLEPASDEPLDEVRRLMLDLRKRLGELKELLESLP